MWLKYLSSLLKAKAYMRKFRPLTAEEFQTSYRRAKSVCLPFCILNAPTLSRSHSIKSHPNSFSISIYFFLSLPLLLLLTFLHQHTYMLGIFLWIISIRISHCQVFDVFWSCWTFAALNSAWILTRRSEKFKSIIIIYICVLQVF